MSEDLIKRLKLIVDNPWIFDRLAQCDVEAIQEAITALSPVMPDDVWYDTCASLKRVIVDNVDVDANSIVSECNDILDTAFGLQAPPMPDMVAIKLQQRIAELEALTDLLPDQTLKAENKRLNAVLSHLWEWLPIRYRVMYIDSYPDKKEVIDTARNRGDV